MSCKKIVLSSVLIGAIVAFHVAVINGSLDYKLFHLRRKINCLSRKVNRALKCVSEENLKKYEQEIVKGYENIKEKVDNLTIKDIKDKGNELIGNIYDSIMDLKQKILTYTK